MKLKTDIFPLNYLKNIWTPLTAFKNRFELNWLMSVAIMVFLNALLVIPVTLNYAEIESFPLEDYYPNAVEMIDKQAVEELKQQSFQEGELIINRSFRIKNEFGEIVGGLSKEEREEVVQLDNFIAFDKNQFIIGEEGLPTATVLYTKDFTLEGVEDEESVVTELSRQWLNQNRVLIVLFFSLLIAIILFFMLVFLVFGSALLLYFTRKGKLTTIETYKESVNLILNSLGVPTLAALAFGLIHFDLYLMVTIQTMGLVIYLFVIWYKTKFNDYKLEKASV